MAARARSFEIRYDRNEPQFSTSRSSRTNIMRKGVRFLLLVLLCALALASCAPQKNIVSAPGRTGLPGHKAQDPRQALEKYGKYLAATHPGDPARVEAWKNTVDSAIQLGDYALAEKSLRQWQFESGKTVASWPWNQSHAHLLWASKGRGAYTAYLSNLMERKDLEWLTREAAGRELSGHFWEHGEYSLAFDAMGFLYRNTSGASAKGALESDALARAESLSPDELQKVLDSSLGADPTTYPWSMVVWAQSMKRLDRDKDSWPSVWPSLSGIVNSGELANRDFFAGSLHTLEQKLGAVRQSLVLLLPLSGPYSKVGWQIAKGADCAWRENKALSVTPEIKLINTESPTFLEELQSIPNTPLVGGPLRKNVWEKIRMAGLNRSIRFLTFLPSVEDEGREAWRFFSSPEDQARALVKGCNLLGITSFAILHPQDRFGMAMTSVFQDEVYSTGGQLPVVRGYDMDNPPTWTKAVGAVLGASDAKNSMNPEPPFQAVFLPDSMFRVQQLAPLFHYYEEKRLVLLGPQAWSQSMGGGGLEMQYFDLAVFPGAWDPSLGSGNAARLRQGMIEGGGRADMWAALGYDFVRFTALLGGGQGSAENFNLSLAQSASRMPWTMAPMHWTNGRVRQELFLFQPTPSGMVRASMDKIRNIRAQRQGQREERCTQLDGQ